MMAQIRTGLRAYAQEGHPPAKVVEELNRLALSLSDSQMTTLAYVAVDLDRERIAVVNAGHLPPALRPPDGETRYLPVEGGLPLGVGHGTRYTAQEFELPAGEHDPAGHRRRRRGARRGDRRRPGAAARGCWRPRTTSSASCEAVARGDVRGTPASDDVAVIAARLEPLPEALRTRWPADSDALARMRPLLRRWLGRLGAGPDEIYDIVVAVQEASANAIEHAYAPGGAEFEVDADHAGGVVTVVIRDRGRWRAPRGTHRGRGLSMMRALMETWTCSRPRTARRSCSGAR